MKNNSTVKKAMVGNYASSRIGNHSYTQSTDYAIYSLELLNGKIYWIQEEIHTMRGKTAYIISVPEKFNGSLIEDFHEIPVKVRECLAQQLLPTIEEQNIFVFGIEAGNRLNQEEAWINAHLLGNSKEITRYVRFEIGNFEIEKDGWLVTTSGERYRVKIEDRWSQMDGSYKSYSLKSEKEITEEEAKEIAEKKYFGRKVKELAHRNDVPWYIGKLAYGLPNADKVLSDLKSLKGIANVIDKSYQEQDMDLIHELLDCGIDRRSHAIMICIGYDLYEKLSCKSQTSTTRLARWLCDKSC